MKLRAEKTAEVYKQKNRKVIFTGGFKTRNDLSEAKFMADVGVANGIKPEDIILEEKANTTVENAIFSEEIMNKIGANSAVVITSPHSVSNSWGTLLNGASFIRCISRTQSCIIFK